MSRPVRPIALVILTACMAYPGVTLLWQGLYPFAAGDYFNLVGQTGPWMMLASKLHIAPIVVLGLKALLGLLWVLGVLGLWAGDGRAYAFDAVELGRGGLVDVNRRERHGSKQRQKNGKQFLDHGRSLVL